jgi:hypothetical protein
MKAGEELTRRNNMEKYEKCRQQLTTWREQIRKSTE